MKKIYVIIFLSIYIVPLPAQEKKNDYKYWMTIGVFLSQNNISSGFSYSFSLGKYFYKAGYFARSAFSLGDGTAYDNTGHYYKSVDICIGQRFQSEWFQSAFFAGPAYVFGKKSVNDEKINYGTAGLQTDIQLLFRAANEIGLGIGLYANFNFEQSYAGININITFSNGK